MAELLDVLAVDRTRLSRNSVVVTGSNGKGSTAAFCAGIARAYGLRTGLFTSPHLYRVNERFQVDGADIGDDDLYKRGEVAAFIGWANNHKPDLIGGRDGGVSRIMGSILDIYK